MFVAVWNENFQDFHTYQVLEEEETYAYMLL